MESEYEHEDAVAEAAACVDEDDRLQQASPQQDAEQSWQQQQQQQDEPLQQADKQVDQHPVQYAEPAVPDVLSSAGVIVRNRGTLAAAAGQRQQQLTKQEQLLQEWQGFATRQAQRYVPASHHPNRRTLQDSACYRLRVLHVDNLPPPQLNSGVQFGLQLGVTLFDEAAGQHYGSTCYSLVEPLQGQQQQPSRATDSEPSVDFSFDVFFHTTIADAHCMAVVELVLVELEEDGSCRTKFSAGWAQVPLFARKEPAAGIVNTQLTGGQSPASAPVMSGTPRYLQLRAVCGNQLPPPAVLGSCMVAYQVEAFPVMNPVRPLLPQDFLVTYTDLIPGLQRFDLAGQPSTALQSTLNTLASPLLAAPCAVSIEGVHLIVPQLLHNLLSVLPELLGAVPPPELASLLSVPCQPDAVGYSMRLGVHNGRTFVGPWVTAQLQVQPHLGSLVLSPAPGQQLAVDCLLQDRLVTLVLEFLAAPTLAGAAAAGLVDSAAAVDIGAVLVGRSVLGPFEAVAADGTTAVLAAGKHKLAFDSSSCLGSLCSSSCWAPKGCSISMLAASSTAEAGDLLLPLNWRAMLGDTATRTIPDPSVQLELQPTGRVPQLPGVATAAAAAAVISSSVKPPAFASTVQANATCTRVSTTVQTMADVPAEATPAVAGPAAAAAGFQAPMRDSSSPVPTREPPMSKTLGHESPAAMSLKLAAQHLEEAANIPVQTPSTSTCGARQSAAATETQVDAASRQQLQQLADAMQQQLDLLANAVAELRQERQTLRSSLTMLESAAQTADSQAQQRAEAALHAARQQQQQQQQQVQPPANNATSRAAAAVDLEWLSSVPETAHGDVAGFSGQVLHEPYQGLQPSRAVLQQLHEAGMTHALPADVQARLQAQAALGNLSLQQRPPQQPPHTSNSRMAALLLDVEARDPRTASSIVLQLLAFRPTAGPAAAMNLPSSLSSLYFTLQFYKSGPVVTNTCLLEASPQGQHAHAQGPDAGGTGSQGPSTFVLLPQQQGGAAPAGAGVVLKFSVDGSRASELLPGQDPVQAASQAHLAFCKYLISHKLAVDVWDGDSLLQLGSCTTDLSGLLRQGRDLLDLLLELPLLKHCSTQGSSGPAPTAVGQLVGKPQGPVQLGTLVLRLINIGQEPSNMAGGVMADASSTAPGTPGKKVCVRAAPLQPGSPVAKELRGGNSPFAADWRQYSAGGAGTGDGSQPQDVSASTDAALAAADIIGLEQRKLAREQKLRELLHSPNSSPKHSAPGALQWHGSSAGQHSPTGKLASTWSHSSPNKGHQQQQQQQQQQWRPGSPLSTVAAGEGGDGVEPYKALQQQLLSDVEAVRKRQKPGFTRSQLRKGLVTQCSIRASPGQTLLLEHTLTNSIGRDAVFELRVSHPAELTAVESLQELKDLQQSIGSTAINTAAAAGVGSPVKGAVAAGGTALPLKLRQLAQQAIATGGVAGNGGRQLVSRGRIFLGAKESVSIPFRFLLQCEQTPAVSSSGGSAAGSKALQQHHQQPQQQHTVTVDFVPLGLDWPVSILELAVQPEPAVVDRTLRYHCPERELLHAELPLTQLPGMSGALLAAAAAGKLTVAASRPDVGVSVLSREQQHGQQQQCVCLRYRCGGVQDAAQFYVWLYSDAAMAQPLEAWQVFVHPLQRVDMRAIVGQQSSTTLAIAGGSADRLVAVYSSHPGGLQASPAMLSLPAGGISALGLVFKPRSPGQQKVRVHLVDVNTRQLVHALIVCTDAHLPPLHRHMEVQVHAGAVSQHQLEVTNSTNRPASYTTTTNTPWLLSVTPSGPQHIPAGSTCVLSVVCDARALAPGATESGLVFVSDAQNSLQHEECIIVTIHVV